MTAPLVSVYSDASVRLRRGAWGAVVVRDDGTPPSEASGHLKADALDCTALAEMQAAANALAHGIKAGLVRTGDHVTIRLDCTPAMKRIRHGSTDRDRKRRPDIVAVVDWIRKAAGAGGFVLTARHVKGHQPERSTDPHAIHNRRCDKLAGVVLSPPKKALSPAEMSRQAKAANRERRRAAARATIADANRPSEHKARLRQAFEIASKLAAGEEVGQ